MAVPDDGRRHQISFGASLGNLNAFRVGHIIYYHIISYSIRVSLVWGVVSESAA